MIKVMTIFGTRAEAIKMIPIIEELNQNQHTNCIVCVTGQHREMLDQVLDTFNIVPHYDLNIMKQDQSLTEITTKSIIGLEKIITKENPKFIGGIEKSRKLSEIYEDIAMRNDCDFIGNEDWLVGEDGIHLSRDGHRILASKLSMKVKEIFK